MLKVPPSKIDWIEDWSKAAITAEAAFIRGPSSFPRTLKFAFAEYSTSSSSLSWKTTFFTFNSSRIDSSISRRTAFSSGLRVTNSTERSGWRFFKLYWLLKLLPIETAFWTVSILNSRAKSRLFSSATG